MDPLKYRHPVLVHPPFRDQLVAAVAGRVGDDAVGVINQLLPLLDGTRGVADIYGRLLADGVSPGNVNHAFDALEALGCLADASAGGAPAAAAENARYRGQVACLEEWLKVRQGADEAQAGALNAQAALAAARVMVMGLGRSGGALIEALSLAGVGQLFGIRAGCSPEVEESTASQLAARVAALNPQVQYAEITSLGDEGAANADSEPAPPLLVYCPDQFQEAVCQELNRVVLQLGSSLLIYRESPFCVELGPLIVPKRTACYVCYQLRRQAAEPGPEPDEPASVETPSMNFACGIPLLALEIVKILTRAAFPVTRGKLWRLGLFDGTVSVHPVLKLPRCPACGVHRRTPPRRIWEE
jgi:bacteriocin biosynthesis cyclodehydratase domain-containing protein